MQHTNANPISKECIKSNKNKMISKEPFETFQTPPLSQKIIQTRSCDGQNLYWN